MKREEAEADALSFINKAKAEEDTNDEKSQSKDKNNKPKTENIPGIRKVGHFLSFGSLKQKQEEEENEYIDNEEIGYTLYEGHSEIPDCPICDKVFNSLESYGEHIKKNYYFCTKCSNLFENEIEFKKHEIYCEKCEHCGRNNHIGKCITNKSNLNKGKKKGERID